MTTGNKRGRKSQSPPKEQQVGNASTPTVVSASTEANHQREKSKQMSDVASIIEYDTPLDAAEAPVPLPKGDYTARIRGAERKMNKAGDNEYINVTFIIDADQYPADYTEGEPEGTTLSYGRLSPANTVKARWQMKRFCESIGAELGSKLDLNDWLDKTAVVEVVNEDYQGVMQAKIAKVRSA
jgi:hypothetical protein